MVEKRLWNEGMKKKLIFEQGVLFATLRDKHEQRLVKVIIDEKLRELIRGLEPMTDEGFDGVLKEVFRLVRKYHPDNF